LAAGLSPTRQIIVNGFITSGGQKMSKSLGNVINPASVVSEYGADALRYYFARELNPFEDGDFTMEKFKAAYNGNLANGLGNLTSRIIKMSETYLKKSADADDAFEFPKEFSEYLEKFELNKAVDFIWRKIGEMDSYIQKNQPFKVVKKNRKEGEKMIVHLVGGLSDVANLLSIFMPNASENIKKAIKENKMLEKNLFPRKE
ncbi:MAG: class I tRNA ligase family protein, partial [Patescibacteria group bacterium]|nr:class I tRNA ligase family protein [Patescibacteria group bacterium]